MPPKKPATTNPPKNTKKAKFSATMPEFDEHSQDSSLESEQNQSNFDQESNSKKDKSDEMELSESSSQKQSQSNKKPNKMKKSSQSKEESENESQASEEGSSEEQQRSSPQISQEQYSKDQKQSSSKHQQKVIKKPSLKPITQASYVPAQQQSSQKSQKSNPVPILDQEREEIPQQQVQTDDFDSQSNNQVVSNNQINKKNEPKKERQKISQEKEERQMDDKGKEEESEYDIYVPLRNDYRKVEQERIVLEGEEVQQVSQVKAVSEKIVEQHKEHKMMGQEQKIISQGQKITGQEHEIAGEEGKQEGDKKKNKKSKKKSKKDKNNQPQQNPVQSLKKQPPNRISQEHIPPNKEQSHNQQQQLTHQSSDQQNNLFYQTIYPYLTGIGQLIINDFMKTHKNKKKFTSLEALKWGRDISNTFLVKAFMSEVKGIDHLELEDGEEQEEKKKKVAIVDDTLKQDKFYRKVLKQLSDENLAPVSFGNIYFLMKRFKLIVSCLVICKIGVKHDKYDLFKNKINQNRPFQQLFSFLARFSLQLILLN